MSPERIAEVCHNVNKALCQELGDNSQVSFRNAPLNIKASVLDGVKFHLENPDAGPSASHENWLKFKRADGWIYGLNKDPLIKTHPCLRPYNELPKEQRVKDHIFHSLVLHLKD